MPARGRFDAFHRRVFRAALEEGRDIERADVLRALGDEVGLDGAAMVAAARAHAYHDRLDRIERDRRWYDLRGTPTFIVANRRLAGAQPYPVLRSLVEQVGARRRAGS